MAKDFVETRGSETACFEKHDEPRWCSNIVARLQSDDDGLNPAPPDSLICPNTGQVTLHDVSDLRAQLEQFRLGRTPPPARVTPEAQRAIAVDDELRGREGEWLVVIDFTSDGQVLTLQCCETGRTSARAVGAVLEDLRNLRLKVHRYGTPDIPPELEG